MLVRRRAIPETSSVLEAVAEFITDRVVPASSGGTQFQARVAASLLRTVARELALGALVAERADQRRASLGTQSAADLATQIRAGEFDDRIDELAGILRGLAIDRLAIVSPGYVEPADRRRMPSR
jgi:hypothetical protein